MKLFIKQKVFSWKSQFYVKDEKGEDKYSVKGELFSWGKKLHIYDSDENEIALLKQKLISFLPRFEVIVGGEKKAVVVREFTFLKPKYRIEGPDWDVTGDFFAHEYKIMKDDKIIVSISKEWLSWGDTYELDIKDSENEILALSVVLAIDSVLEAQSNNN